MNSLLSTSLQEVVAEFYVPQNDINVIESDEVSVIFQIEADPHLPGGIKPFANIANYSQFPIEKEVLFMAGCIFQITEIINTAALRMIKMKLCSNTDNNLKTLFESLRREYGGEHHGYENEATMSSFGVVLYNADKYDIADRFFRRMYNEASIDDPKRAAYCHNIGNVALHHGQYEESAQWYDRALALYETNGIVNRPSVAILHLVRGNLYSAMKKRKRALESYEKALTIYRTNFGENHPKIACCYHNMASEFERRKSYRTAVEYRKRAIEIAETTLTEMHPDFITYHTTLARLVCDLRHRELELALKHANKSLEIAGNVLPSDHSEFLHLYETLGGIYQLMGKFNQSTIYFDKIDAFNGPQSINIQVQKVLNRRKEFPCIRCHRRTWIYRSFEWMKDTRFNCLIFHRLGFFLLDIIRYSSHY